MAKTLSGFGVRILAADPFIDQSIGDQYGVTMVDMKTLFRECDYISLHVPLVNGTEHLIGKELFDEIPDHLVFINSARGGVVVEQEMIDAGVPDWYIGSCKKIKYLFPKAHAVAYVMMAFRIAWFKVHHPLAFYSAYFYRRSQKGGFDAVLMTHGKDAVVANIDAIENNENATDKDEDLLTTMEVVYEYYLRGFDFLPIDIYKSHATKFLVEDGKILPPFVAISGLGENAAWDLMRGREGKTFLSVEEVAAACPKVSKTHIQMLKDAGAFGSLPDTSQISLF